MRSCLGMIALLYLNFTFGVSGMVLCRIYHHLLVSEVLLVGCLVLVMYVVIAKFV